MKGKGIKRNLILSLCFIFITACSSIAEGMATPTASSIAATPAGVTTSLPGLVIRGHVRRSDGSGLANVSICRNFASYAGTLVATTDEDGYFQADFVAIPGDEMVGVWAALAGYTFEPKYHRWRHYYGFEDQTLDFVAVPTSATEVPPAPCS